MAFTKINAAGIGTTETVTVDGLTVINNESIGGNLTVTGNATVSGVLTYEDVTNVDSIGIITARAGVLVGSGITLSKDGDVFFTGIATGNGSGLTALNASNLASGTVPTARLGSGTASSSTFLRGDSTFQTVNTDLVSDTSPQLGGDLASNGNDIIFADNDKAIFGTGSDLKIYHNGTHNYFLNSNGDYVFDTGSSELARLTASGNFGVGTNNPTSKIDIHCGSDNTGLQITSTDAGAFASYFDNTGASTIGHQGTNLVLSCDPAGSVGNSNIVFQVDSNSEKARIDSSGLVGIGSDAPTHNLDIHASGNPYLKLLRSGYNPVYIGNAAGEGVIETTGATFFKTGGSERLRINSDGTLKYGQSFGDTDGKIITVNSATNLCKTFMTSGSYTMSSTLSKSNANSHPGTLEVRADANGPSIICGQLGNSNTAGAYSGLNISLEYPKLGLYAASVGGAYGAADFVLCNNSASSSAMATLSDEKFRIFTNGKIRSAYTYSGTTTGGGPIYVESDGDFLRYTSSRKYKTDIETLEDARADNILNCRPVWYKSLSENDIKTPGADKSDWGWYGFIAEEVAEIEPRLVNWATKDAKTEGANGSVISVERDPSNYEAEGVRYDNFVPLLVNLVKRQKAEIESLKARLDAAGL